MDRSDKRIDLQGADLAEVRKLLGMDGKLNAVEIAHRSWHVCSIDDKSIFDEDARRLANAFRSQYAKSFYVARVSEIMSTSNSVVAYQFEVNEDQIEAFQGPSYYEVNLDDCVLFNRPITCIVLRPGSVDSTDFAGNVDFIGEIRA
ncbi:hypothetical protein [Paraburkholderia terrae]|uniref:Uncharacterized protein n=1 Tax=Paraburkholderia terrae TaxID=311230 RepID=A0A2I8EZZ2_9BURK|nr:hypothetical protein [Paraburkholderia terrae]AUT64962.1 hypothetical protein C2L65_35775 [Paraburkholderia terrae]